MTALDRLKSIQSNFKRGWNGINCEFSGRPGTSSIVNKKRLFTMPEALLEEDDRSKALTRIFSKVRDLEEDKNNSTSASSFNRTSNSQSQGGGFFNGQ